jgi:uncharacterized membrane protein YebE (DUF533 family)
MIMGLMMRRRRPIARMATAAAVGGVAYHAGKSHEQQAQVNDQAQAAYAATQDQQQPQYAPPPPQAMPPAPQPLPAGGDDSMAQLEKLAEMHGAGVLSDDEFSAAKAKLLGI